MIRIIVLFIILILNTGLSHATEYGEDLTNAALEFGLSTRELHAIMLLESNGRKDAYNLRTRDIGLMQVNERTAELYGFDTARLKRDVSYNVRAGARILSDFKRRYPKTYLCRYNVGTGPLVGPRLKRCANYLRKFQKYYMQIEELYYAQDSAD